MAAFFTEHFGMDERMLSAKCKQLAEYEEVFTFIMQELEREELSKPNRGETAFAVAKQVLEANGKKKGMEDFIGRIKRYAGKH